MGNVAAQTRSWQSVLRHQLKHNRSVQLELNVDNLLGESGPVCSIAFGGQSATGLRPRPTISSPARVTVPGLFSCATPRNYTLSAKLDF